MICRARFTRPAGIRPADQGNTMLVALMVMSILSIAMLCALNFTGSVSRNVQRTNVYRSAVEVGDGVVEHLFAYWREKCRPTPNQHYKGDDFATIPMPDANSFPSISGFQAVRTNDPAATVSNVRIDALDSTWNPVAGNLAPPPSYGMSLGTVSFFYRASADVSMKSSFGAPLKVKMRRILEKQIMSPWNYAIFYVDRLEIHPGPQFNVTGWVHTNERLYTAHNTLTFGSKVTYGEDWYVNFAPGDGSHSGETPARPNYQNNLPPALEQAQQPFGLDSTRIFSSTDTNPNNDSYRELVERPTSGFTDPISDARYYNQADVRLLVDNDVNGNPVLTIKNSGDTTVSSSSTGYDKDLYDVFASAVVLGDKIQDNREGKEIRLVTLDMSKVNTALRSGGKLYNKGFKGVIYTSDISATSSSRRGVRLKNGGIIPPGGITVATDNPCYIQGDYNTGTNGSTQPPSNQSNGDPTQNVVSGYTKQSCAVVADAVMILSNSWSDSNSYNAVGSRQATPTTVNTAIVAGIVPTGTVGNNYSGGAENFPRFMETWGDTVSFTYWGSMVELFASKQNNAIWGKSNVYSPPRRKWYFDRQFYTDPPPGTLSLVSYKKGRWYFE